MGIDLSSAEYSCTCRLYPIKGENDSMKKGAQLFMVFFLVTIFLAPFCGGVAADTNKEKFDIDAELREKTFYIQELDQGKKAGNDYHAYFKNDGVLAIKFSRKHWKYEKWEVDDKGTLCVTTIRRKLNKTTMCTSKLCTSKCGRFVKSSETTYRWYNGDGKHRANFTLQGKGDRLP